MKLLDVIEDTVNWEITEQAQLMFEYEEKEDHKHKWIYIRITE